MKIKCLFLLLFSGLFLSVHATDKFVDSLLQVVNSSKVDSVLLRSHYELLKRLKARDPGAAVQHGTLAVALGLKLNNKKLLGKIYNNLGTAYGNLGSNKKGYLFYQKSYDLCIEIKDSVSAYIAWYNMGLMKSEEGKLTEAMQYYVDARKVFKQYNDTNNMVLPIMGTGGIYAKLGKYKEALKEFQDAKVIIIRTNDVRKLSTCLNNIASTYAYLGDWTGSYETFKEALELHRKEGNMEGVSMVLFNMSTPLIQQKRYDEALALLDSSIAISKQKGYRHNLGVAYQNKAEVLLDLNRPDEAEKYILDGIQLSTDYNEGSLLTAFYRSAHRYYEMKGDYKKALSYFVLATALKDSLVNNEMMKVAEVEKEYNREVKEKEIALLNKQRELEAYQDTMIRTIGTIFVIALVIVLFVLFQRYRQKQKTNRELESMNALIGQKNKDITDSINYASRIQQAILPAKEVKYRLFPDAFVLLLPRDVVSGDFYWFAEKNGKKIIAAVDCTGHGVPGAFMSMIGNSFLNQIVIEEGITQPDTILNELRDRVKKALKQSGEEDDTARDGMDAAVCVLDEKNSSVQYSGANNPLWIFPKEGGFIEIKPDKLPIGIALGEERPFSMHEVQLNKGDMVYIFSDGFADQFGGERNKKMTYRKFRELLLQYAVRPAAEQENMLRDYFKDWMGTYEQTDDVLVIGIRI